MPGYISEYQYFGLADEEFIEIAVPTGTDVSSYSLVLYEYTGFIVESYDLGSVQGTFGGQDVYVIDNGTPGFNSMTSEGEIYADDALALVDDSGTVLQFVSHWGSTVTALEGPANGMTSTDVGTASTLGTSLQTDDGGATYYMQTATNKGSIPACYAPGTRIETTGGCMLVENLRPGDRVVTCGGGPQPVRWMWSYVQSLENVVRHRKPVRIAKDALSPGVPDRDLIVSGQHRIAVGLSGQLEDVFPEPMFVPAKALTRCPGIRHMAGVKMIRWFHLACDDHLVVRANNTASETLLLGDQTRQSLNSAARRSLSKALGRDIMVGEGQTPALRCLTKREACDFLNRARARKAGRHPRADTRRLENVA